MNELIVLHLTSSFFMLFLGASIGSFLNVVAIRYKNKQNFISGRSVCPSCKNPLNFPDLIPIISWLILLGRCRFCKTKISPQYIIVEITTAIIFVLSLYTFGFTFLTPFSIIVSSILMTIALIDFETMEIPDKLNISLIPFAILLIFLQPSPNLLSRGIGIFVVALPMFALALIINGAFGGGDIKLMAVAGFLLGWQNTILAFFIAILIGGSYAIFLLAACKGKKGQQIVFGPALCFGIFISLLYGNDILSWYLDLLMF